MMRVLASIRSQPWAITREMMDTILSIAERQNERPEAVAAKLGRPLDNTYAVENRDGVAILPVAGPLFRYANLFTAISGATSYDTLATDFARAVNDPAVKAIVLNIDSPGGEANGVSEFADQIYAARGTKPIIAYVDGQASSAAYWIAAAADEIVTNDIAVLGSIGAVLTIQDTRERDAKNGVKTYQIVSAQSPYKRVDPATEQGRSRYQAIVDALAGVFIEKVAAYRGVDTETVLQKYGQGDVFVGQAAVDAGLADRIGSFEGVIAELQARERDRAFGFVAAGDINQEVHMDKTNGAPAADTKPSTLTAAEVVAQHPEAAEAIRAEAHAAGAEEGRRAGAADERARVRAILASEEATDRAELAQHLAFDTDMPADAAVAMLAKAPKGAKANGFASFDAAMRAEGNPKVGADAEPKDGEDKAAASLINTAKAIGLA